MTTNNICFYGEIRKKIGIFHLKKKCVIWSYELFQLYIDIVSLTKVRYIERFPGLIHFIYVNRRTNQVMVPALNITHDGDNSTHDATQLLKEKVDI